MFLELKDERSVSAHVCGRSWTDRRNLWPLRALRQKNLQGWASEDSILERERMYVDVCGRAVEVVALDPLFHPFLGNQQKEVGCWRVRWRSVGWGAN